MKAILILVFVIGMVGCGKMAKEGGSILTLNDCQYAIYKNPAGVAMVHAGNCTNPAHVKK